MASPESRDDEAAEAAEESPAEAAAEQDEEHAAEGEVSPDDEESSSEQEESQGDDEAVGEDEQAARETPQAEETTSRWKALADEAQALWDAGDNAALRKVLDELSSAPTDEAEARELARVLGKRLKPDPIAIGLWLLSLGVFSLLTYLFVLR